MEVREERVATAELTSVPEVGSVIDVEPVVVNVKALVAEKVTTSPPANVMAFVPKVVESETVNVFKLVTVNVPVVVVIVNPFNEVAVAAPRAGVIKAGELVNTTFTVPLVEAAEMAVPLPCKIPVMEVEIVMAGVVVAVATVPANPFVETTDTLVTEPELPEAAMVTKPLAPAVRVMFVPAVKFRTVWLLLETLFVCSVIPDKPVADNRIRPLAST